MTTSRSGGGGKWSNPLKIKHQPFKIAYLDCFDSQICVSTCKLASVQECAYLEISFSGFVISNLVPGESMIRFLVLF